MQYLGIDVGGTKTLAVRVDATGTVLDRARLPTASASPGALLDGLVGIATRLRTGDVRGVGVGLPGMVRAGTGELSYAPTFPFGPVGVGTALRSALGLPVVCDNDANAAAWAEHLAGTGDGRHMALVTVGTGLGCGAVVDGRVLRGAHGYAAEVSHLIVEPGGEPCGCGERGCWGIEATGYAVTMRARRAGRDPGAWGVSRPEEITGELVTGLARQGDAVAVEILRRTGVLLGRGLAALANLLDPDVLVIGGGVCAAGELLLGPAREAFAGRLYAPDRRPAVPIVAARLGPDAGAVGAALLAAAEADGAGAGGAGAGGAGAGGAGAVRAEAGGAKADRGG